ncbi:MAG: bifunctional phosphopantothenoylcysteine decarboxylase/phosphopantothenate--cysteine ligase CoaBC [Deltaproteobacteria bacterium]|nr:bifunctional phosphopantothenoylcysteine decarboxylase/phosphopantothenate--cysteine ligase CoaBC [Deltaproteobacteria bacterium]
MQENMTLQENLTQGKMAFVLEDKRIVLGIGGSVAAYKSADLIRDLVRNKARVDVIPTKAALHFVTPLLLEALSQRPVHAEVMALDNGHIPHIELAYAADVVVVCPATADLLASMAQGLAHNALLSTLLSVRCPLLIAPAMETRMWEHPATQANVKLLQERGAHFVGPQAGALASGREGQGRLAPIEEVFEAILAAVTPKDFQGKRVVVTAGPTVEDLDPVRFLSNRSSGKMGIAIAQNAARRGASVILVKGPTNVEFVKSSGLSVVNVRSADEMARCVLEEVNEEMDVAILAAAVADFMPQNFSTQKIKKSSSTMDPNDKSSLDAIALSRTTDILKTLGEERASRKERLPFIAGFAAETENVEENGRKKLEAKQVDLICANDVSGKNSQEVFASDKNSVLLLSKEKPSITLPRTSKEFLANAILDEVRELMG